MIKLPTEITKRLDKEKYYHEDDFKKDCKAYMAAVKSGRILYDVISVSKSGMSRVIKIRSYEGTISKGYYRNYSAFLETLGYSMVNYSDIRVSGCGMDMLFATNYNIIHDLKRMGFITKKTCDILAQKV